MNRKEFLKLSSKSALAVFLTSCNIFTTEEEPNTSDTKKIKELGHKKNSPLLIKNSDNVLYITKDDTNYLNLNERFNKRIVKEPKIIALCKNKKGVSEAIKFAAREKLSVAIKSGGHSFEGFSSNNGGLVVDLSLINTIEWSENNTVTVGSGCKLSQLYEVLLQKKRMIPAGSCGSVGIGGLTLGGGYGFFSRKHGLTCDSLSSFEFVDGNGNLHSSKNNEDLEWACKGGGNGNFGVVTKMTFNTFPAPPTFQSHRFKARHLTAARTTAILKLWFEITEKLPLSCFSAFVLNHKTLLILVTNYEKHTAELQNLLDRLALLCDKFTFGKPVPLKKALTVYYGKQTPVYFKNASAGLYKHFSEIEPFITKVLDKVINTGGLIYQVNTLGGKINDPEKETNSAYAHRNLPYLSELQSYWQKTERSDFLIHSFNEIQNMFKANGIKAHYVNYPDVNFSNWQESYYGKNYEKLKQIKQKFDPLNTIRHEQSIDL